MMCMSSLARSSEESRPLDRAKLEGYSLYESSMMFAAALK